MQTASEVMPITVNPNWIATPTQGLQVNSTAISNDGTQLITGTSAEYASSDQFAIYSYSTDGTSANLQWSDSLGTNVTQGVFWVAISGDGSQGAAGGEYAKGSGNGFLRTYTIASGVSSKQEFSMSGRVNEVEINEDGSSVVCVEENNVHLFSLSSGSYSQKTVNCPNTYMRSCGISDSGSWIVAGGEYSSYDESESSSSGLFFVFENEGGSLAQKGTYTTSSAILRVVISRDGQFAAVSTESGEVLCFSLANLAPTLTPLWTYTPSDVSIGISYALAICHNSNGDLYVGVGGNHTSSEQDSDSPGYGYSYMLQSTYDQGSSSYYANRLWIYQLQYCPNPAMNMDAEGKFVTSADGQPIFSESDNSDTSETPGNFYLFDTQSGVLQWQYHTSLMNWAMAISADGNAIFAGSDDGSVYYWNNIS